MNFDFKDEYDGKVSFKTDKPLVFIHKETHEDPSRPWAVYVLSIDDYESYREKTYFVHRCRSYRRARLSMSEELLSFDGYSEYKKWPIR